MSEAITISEGQTAARRQKRVPSLDGIRALAIILVVACHVQVFIKPLSGPLAYFCVDVGWSGVYLFFVLSGYLIGRLALNEIAETRNVKVSAFWARRALRTWPLYFLALFANYFILTPRNAAPAPPLYRYMTFTQVFSPMNYFIESWTLCIEEQFYLFLPIFFLLVLKVVSPKRIGIACLVVIGLSYLYRARSGYALHPASTFDALFLGVLIAHAQRSGNRVFDFIQRRSYSTALAGIVILSLPFLMGNPYSVPQFQGFLSVGFGLILVSALNPQSMIARVLSTKILKLIALSSYSTYLVHVAVILALGHFRLVPVGPSRFLGPIIFVVTSCVVFLAGWMVYRYIEKPGLRLREILVPRRVAVQPDPKETSQPRQQSVILADAQPLPESSTAKS